MGGGCKGGKGKDVKGGKNCKGARGGKGKLPAWMPPWSFWLYESASAGKSGAVSAICSGGSTAPSIHAKAPNNVHAKGGSAPQGCHQASFLAGLSLVLGRMNQAASWSGHNTW